MRDENEENVVFMMKIAKKLLILQLK